jgi:hypothetical protein
MNEQEKKEYAKQYYLKNKERLLAKMKEYQENNKDYQREYRRDYYKEYREFNKEKNNEE